MSWWVSPKRTRSYPYQRVYDSLNFLGKKITIIPIYKDEGIGGDRDFLQWDTVSLMSLLGVYVVISYYKEASKSSRYHTKITKQRFDVNNIETKIRMLLSYQSDALHWNLSQVDKVGDIGLKALESYETISKKLNVDMHSRSSAEKRISKLFKGKETFIKLSRELAKKAQQREIVTIQPKEKIKGTKASLTIKNYLGGYYYFTTDEVEIHQQNIYLIECKHTKTAKLPSLGDIKDGLLKMILFTNLEDVKVDGVNYKPFPILKLTTGEKFNMNSLSKSQAITLNILRKEAKTNNFRIMINDEYL